MKERIQKFLLLEYTCTTECVLCGMACGMMCLYIQYIATAAVVAIAIAIATDATVAGSDFFCCITFFT